MKMKSSRNRLGCLILTGALLLGTAGCGAPGKTQDEEPAQITLTGEMVPVADYEEVKYDLSSLDEYQWTDGRLLYLEKQWDKERGLSAGTLYQVSPDGTGAPKALYGEASGENALQCFFPGQDGALYFLEWEIKDDGTGDLCLQKRDGNLGEIYTKALTDEAFRQALTQVHASNPSQQALGFFPTFSGLYVDAAGNIMITDYADYSYFFDAEGQYLGQDTVRISQGRFIDAGEQGCFFVRQDWDSPNIMSYQFQKVASGAGRLGGLEIRDLSTARPDSPENGTVLGGQELGILVSMEHKLFSYDYDAGELTELLSWEDLEVDGSTIKEIHFLQKDFPAENLNGYTVPLTEPAQGPAPGNTPEISPVLEALSSNNVGESEIVRVGHLDHGYVPEKKQVTLGISMMSTLQLGRQVRSFNRSNREYQIVIKDYESPDAFTEELISHPSELPDVLEIGWLNKEMLDSKGLLEDLTPYFEDSDVIGENDILEAVWKACESDGKITGMMTSFSVLSLSTTADTLPRDGWTYDQLFRLGMENPDNKLLPVYTPSAMWVLLSHTMDSYLDWDKGECHFDSPEFMRLLENIKGLPYPENQEDQRTFYSDEEDRKFLRKEFLLQYDYYYSPYDFGQFDRQFKDKAWNVGFPTQDGELCYILNPNLQFSIYGNSPNKEGAWAFLEFVLSEGGQSWYGSEHSGFPVRRDAFEAYLTKPYHPFLHMEGESVSDERTEMIRETMEHLHVEKLNLRGEIANIIYEEIQAFFAGDKTAQQCVDIIQNRVQLYLEENF